MDIKLAKSLFLKDQQHSSDWRKQTKEDFKFVGGEQFDEHDKQWFEDNDRPMIIYNRTATVINAVVGNELQNRNEIRYFPVEEGDIQPNELLTEAAKWFRNQSDGDDAESEAFRDACICGMGWTETTINYDENPDGDPSMSHIDCLEMFWDCNARKKSIVDATRLWRARQMTLAAAKDLFPDLELPDEAYNADWAKIDKSDGTTHDQTKADEYASNNTDVEDGDDGDDESSMVTLVHCVYKKRVKQWRAIDPETQKELWMDDEEYNALNEKFMGMGQQPLQGVRQRRTIWVQCYYGKDLLEQEELPTNSFPYKCITGYQDRLKGTWYGMVRAMRDPQTMANKWLSNGMHISNTTAKGGIFAERGITDDERKFEESWAQSDTVTWVMPGAAERIKPKYVQTVPAEIFTFIQMAIEAIRDVTGLNLEMLGQRAAIQPIGIEQERKQAGLTILAPLFDSLRMYRKAQGRMMLDIIKGYMNDGRLIRITGQAGMKYAKLAIAQDTKYDVFVDETPVGPHMKEKVWSFIAPMLPELPPPIVAEMIAYAPLPQSVIEKMQAILKQMAEQKPEQVQKIAAELAKAWADVEMTKQSAFQKKAQGIKHLVDAGQQVVETLTGGQSNGQDNGRPIAQ
jgi:hypothetical protein